MIITLDGPTASGKSSIARALAQKMGGMHFNSGFIYRCIGYIAARDYGFTKESITTISEAITQNIVSRIQYEYIDTARIIFDGVDSTQELKQAQVDVLASCVSELAYVRDVVNKFARSISYSTILIADGRDCGTVMFPSADYKFFITASIETRAQRWLHDQEKQGKQYSFEQALALVNERDARDMQRVVAPLKRAPDALVVDTSELLLEEIIEKLYTLIPVN